jgi:hypothetical protein
MSPAIVIGRALAVFTHPRLAWRVLSPAGRTLLAGAYFGTSYVAALTALLIFG